MRSTNGKRWAWNGEICKLENAPDSWTCKWADCYLHPTKREKWNDILSMYMIMMNKLYQKKDFIDAGIKKFQNLADWFCMSWLDLVGRDGISNCFHIIETGYFCFFLKQWRNLYKYQNEGWEAYNALIKSFYHQCMQKGSFSSRNTMKSRIKPLGLWMMKMRING